MIPLWTIINYYRWCLSVNLVKLIKILAVFLNYAFFSLATTTVWNEDLLFFDVGKWRNKFFHINIILWLFLDNDTNHSNTLADNQSEYPLNTVDGWLYWNLIFLFNLIFITDLDQIESQLFYPIPSEYIDSMAILPINNSGDENPVSTKENPTTSFVVKLSVSNFK